MPKLWIYHGAKSTPDSSSSFEDSDADWADALAKPEVLDKSQKTDSLAVCGAEFADGSTTKAQTPDNLLWSHALVLDVDVWREDRPPFTLEELQERFEGIRFIAWNSFSSSDLERRWRVVVPLKTPMPPTKYRSLWNFLNEALDHTMAESTSDPGRLGFLGSLGSETGKDHYRWCIGEGEYLDWTTIDLEEEDLKGHKKSIDPLQLDRSPEWISDDQALKSAKRYFKKTGEDIEVGNRHAHLLKVGCRLWWEWALDEDQVRTVLHEVNQSFLEPKAESDVEAEVSASFERVFGEGRVEQPSLYGSQRDPIDRSSVASITEHGKRLRRSQDDSERLVGRALLSIAKGEPIGDPTEARMMIHKASEELARSYSRDTPERLLDLMRPSLRAQRGSSSKAAIPTDSEILNWISHVQKIQRTRIEEKEKEKQDDRSERIEIATRGARNTPYTAQEYKKFESKGLTDRRWILWNDRSFYLFSNGDYVGPFSEKTAQLEAYCHFAAAEDRVKLETMTKDGRVRSFTIDELAKKHGSPVSKVFCRIDKEKGSYRPKDSILEVSCSTLRKLDPEFSPEVDEWLQRLAGSKYDVLCEWLASLTYLDKPLAALFLCTNKGQGKNLLVEGLARLWSTGGYSPLHNFQSQFLEHNPLVFCDERLPKDWLRDPSGKLRQFVSQSVRPVKRPYVSEYFLTGYARLMFSSNTPTLFRSEQEVSSEESLACADRVLMINTLGSNNAGGYLSGLSNSGFVLDDFILKDIIAKHALWLRDNKNIDFRKRFFVEDSQNEFMQASLVADDLSDRVFNWIFSFLEVGKYQNDSVLAKNGEIYVSAASMYDIWDFYDAKKTDLSIAKLGRVLSKIGDKKVYLKSAGASSKKKCFRKLHKKSLEYWLQCNNKESTYVDDLIKTLEDTKTCTVA